MLSKIYNFRFFSPKYKRQYTKNDRYSIVCVIMPVSGTNEVNRMKPITTTIEDKKCPPAIIPELTRLLSNGLLFLIEYRTATVHPCDGFIPWRSPKRITPSVFLKAQAMYLHIISSDQFKSLFLIMIYTVAS